MADPIALRIFSWDTLGQYKALGKFPDLYPENIRTFYSPDDGPGIHAMLLALINSAAQSLVLNMYGFDDFELDAALIAKAQNPKIYVQMSLDSSQAAGKHEAALLATWQSDKIGTSIAIGQSIKHAISHLKVLIVDGMYMVSGSTNWSLSGEEAQDNELTLIRDPVRSHEARSILDRNHDFMLAQMQGTIKHA